MFHVLIDTSVWLDLAQDPKQLPLVDSLEQMSNKKLLTLIVPRIVLTEFEKNRGRVAERAKKSLSSQFQQVKDAIRKSEGTSKQTKKVLEYLDDVGHKIPMMGGMASSTLDRLEKLLKASTPLETSDTVKIQAADRSLNRKAPCHLDKNSMADAMLIETYLDCLKSAKPKDRYAFVTHNKNDFSNMEKDQRLPHPDLALHFSKIKSMYCLKLGDFLKRIDPYMVADALWEHTYDPPVRSLNEIQDFQDFFTDQVWYNRHMNLVYRVKKGEITIVPERQWHQEFQASGFKHDPSRISAGTWDGIVTAGKGKAKELGKKNIGPWSDFEWGMINGKLSALRWSLGDEWDSLDT